MKLPLFMMDEVQFQLSKNLFSSEITLEIYNLNDYLSNK